jgi:hypothetical protein
MVDVDSALRRLSEEAAPPELSSIDNQVLARVQGHSFTRESMHLRVGAVGFALLMGIAGGMLPDTSAKARSTAPVLSEAVDLAPSTLLAGAQ